MKHATARQRARCDKENTSRAGELRGRLNDPLSSVGPFSRTSKRRGPATGHAAPAKARLAEKASLRRLTDLSLRESVRTPSRAARVRIAGYIFLFPTSNGCARISCNERPRCAGRQNRAADCALRVGHGRSHLRDGRKCVGQGDTTAKPRYRAMAPLG